MPRVDVFGIVDRYIERLRLTSPLSEEDVFNVLASLGEEGPWALYPNPMRSDGGVFLCVEGEIKPYSIRGVSGEPQYPATPPGPCWPVQLPREMAARLVERLGAEES